jgi:hypothetical protein
MVFCLQNSPSVLALPAEIVLLVVNRLVQQLNPNRSNLFNDVDKAL